MQILEYNDSEDCDLFDALMDRHGTLKIEEVRKIQKRINQWTEKNSFRIRREQVLNLPLRT